MRRAAEIIAFLGLSAMVHAGVMMCFGNSPGGSQAQGDTGADQITLAAAPDSMAALAARWAEPPQAATSPTAPHLAAPANPPQAPAFDTAAPQLSLPTTPLLPPPDMPPLAPDITDTAPPPAMDRAMEQSPRPTPRPVAASAPPPSAPQSARTAQGQGGGAISGSASAPEQINPAPSQSHHQNLMAQWGGQIMARIERARPRVNTSGQVTLALKLTRGGYLAELSVARSSGDAILDQAAMSAVRRAGRFPPAPDGLTEASYAFSLPVRFR